MARARILTCWLVCAMAMPLLAFPPTAAAAVPAPPSAAPAAVTPTISTFATGVNPSGGMALAPDGSLYVGDTAGNVVRRIDPQGAVTVVAGTGGVGDSEFLHPDADALSVPLTPQALAFDDQGVLYIAADGASLYAMTPDGVLHGMRKWLPLEPPNFHIGYPTITAIDVIGDTVRISKRIWWRCHEAFLPCPVTPVASIVALPRYGLSGATVTELTDPAIFSPSGLAHGLNGERYVTAGTVKRYDVSPVATYDLGSFSPPSSYYGESNGIATDPSGRVVLTITNRHVVVRIEADSSRAVIAGTLDTMGSSGDGGDATAALLKHPSAVAIAPDGTIFVGSGTDVRRITPADPVEVMVSAPLDVTGAVVRHPDPAAVRVSWSPGWYQGGSAVTGYTVTSVPGGLTCQAVAPATSCTVTGLTPGQSYQFSVVAHNAQGPGPPGLSAPVLTRSGSAFHAVTPTRVLDSRTATGGWSGPLSAGGAGVTNLTIPAGVVAGPSTAVVLNVTVTGGSENSFVTVFPAGASVPTASSVNFAAGQTIANLVTVQVGAANEVAFFNAAGSVHVVADLVGYYEDTDEAAGAGFVSQSPVRVLDSRTSIGGWFGKVTSAAAQTLAIPGLPPTATAVVLNVTATNSTADSYLKVAPWQWTPMPAASNLNFAANQTVANLVTVELGLGDGIRIITAAGATDVVADLVGYYDTAAGDWFHPLAPERALDSRGPIGGWSAPLLGGEANVRDLVVAGNGSVPASAVTVAMNSTVTNASNGSFLTVFPSGAPVPTASTLNFAAGETRANQAVVRLGTGGAAGFFNALGSTHVIADVVGYFGPT